MVLVEDDGRKAARLFRWAVSVGSDSLKKFKTSWLSKLCLVLLFRRSTSLNRNTVHVHTRSSMHAVFVCFRNPPNYDMDHRVFNVPTRSFNACIYTRVCLYLFCKTEWLPISWEGGVGVAWGPFFHSGGPFDPLL